MSGGMTRPVVRLLARWLAVMALCLQALSPVSMAVAGENGVDLSRYLCVTPGVEVSAQTRAAARELAVMLGEAGDEAPSASDETCPLCTISTPALLPLPPAAAGPCCILPAFHPAAYAPGLFHRPHGPPVGVRGPPVRA